MTDLKSKNSGLQKSIKELFPFKELRDNQENIIKEIIEAFKTKKFVILEAPTGTGKSPIGITISKYFSQAHIITPQKILQRQYKRDFDFLYNMMGRSNYPCVQETEKFIEEYKRNPATKKELYNTSCASGICQNGVKTLCDTSCFYKRALIEANLSNFTLHNFDSFFYQRRSFSLRNLLIIDECHNIESKFMSFISFTISNKDEGGTIPNFKNIEDYISFLPGYANNLSSSEERYRQRNETSKANETRELVDKIKRFLTYATLKENPVKFIFEFKDEGSHQSVKFRPIYVSRFTDLFFSFGGKILLMSATILNYEEFCKNVGINLDEAHFISVDSVFPVQNREVYFSGELDLKWYPQYKGINPEVINKIPKVIERYLKMYSDEKGIIHTHTNNLLSIFKKMNNTRFTFKDEYKNEKEMMEAHEKKKSSVLVGSGFSEGLDLKDDLSRFQIILKIPYPDLSDLQIKERMELDKDYYGYLSCLKLIQSYGRSVRSKEDYCDTYILDKMFKIFYGMNKKMLPKWFREAIVWQ